MTDLGVQTPGVALAHWVQGNYTNKADPLTHLKLQKLVFYCYSAALSMDCEDELGDISFEAWKHGPVNRDIYQEYKVHGGAPIAGAPLQVPVYSDKIQALFSAILKIYGRMDSFAIRNQSHLERPWIITPQGQPISKEELRAHFKAKFQTGRVRAPEYSRDRGSFGLDGIPVPHYEDLFALSKVISARSPIR